MEERKSGLKLEGYPNYIAPYNIDKLNRRHHPLGKFPVYPTTSEPDSWYEEVLASERYKNLVDEWCRIHNKDRQNVVQPGMQIMMMIGMAMNGMITVERGKYRELERIAEDTVRAYFHLDETEVLFDIEILDPYSGEKPADSFKFDVGEEQDSCVDDPEFTPDFRDELIRRRLTNALIQGASLKGHYLFHMASERLNTLIPNVTDLYNSGMITNDLNYYYFDDVLAYSMSESESQAGAMEIDFTGDVPVIKCRSISFTILMHEMIKGVTEVLFSVGLPKDPAVAEKVIDFCDTVLNEFWDIRLGPKMWEKFFALVPVEQRQYLKHVIVGVAQLETPDFLEFMRQLFADDIQAKNTVTKMIGHKIHEIAEYELEKQNTTPSEPKQDGIDWSF